MNYRSLNLHILYHTCNEDRFWQSKLSVSSDSNLGLISDIVRKNYCYYNPSIIKSAFKVVQGNKVGVAVNIVKVNVEQDKLL